MLGPEFNFEVPNMPIVILASDLIMMVELPVDMPNRRLQVGFVEDKGERFQFFDEIIK